MRETIGRSRKPSVRRRKLVMRKRNSKCSEEINHYEEKGPV
jgi:hypothetical protein